MRMPMVDACFDTSRYSADIAPTVNGRYVTILQPHRKVVYDSHAFTISDGMGRGIR
jgi:hypothetical protein